MSGGLVFISLGLVWVASKVVRDNEWLGVVIFLLAGAVAGAAGVQSMW